MQTVVIVLKHHWLFQVSEQILTCITKLEIISQCLELYSPPNYVEFVSGKKPTENIVIFQLYGVDMQDHQRSERILWLKAPFRPIYWSMTWPWRKTSQHTSSICWSVTTTAPDCPHYFMCVHIKMNHALLSAVFLVVWFNDTILEICVSKEIFLIIWILNSIPN